MGEMETACGPYGPDLTAKDDWIPTGSDLLASWRIGHRHNVECPVCGDPVLTVGITKIVSAHEVCSCDAAKYDHLTEVLYHSVCFGVERCNEFRPFHVRGVRGRPAHDTPDCYVCGRTEASHTQPTAGRTVLRESLEMIAEAAGVRNIAEKPNGDLVAAVLDALSVGGESTVSERTDDHAD